MDEFDWTIGGLTEDFWRRAAESCTYKPSELQLRFACCRQAGLNATDAARRSGCQDDENIRQEGHRLSKTTSVGELLAYAHAETGKGDDGIVTPKESRKILSRIARRGEARARIAALDALAKLDRDEAAANAAPELTLREELAGLIECCPTGGLGAFLGMDMFVQKAALINYPFIRETAPLIKSLYPAEWSTWREKTRADWRSFLDEVASGPVLEGDELVHAVKAKLGPPVRPIKSNNEVEAPNA